MHSNVTSSYSRCWHCHYGGILTPWCIFTLSTLTIQESEKQILYDTQGYTRANLRNDYLALFFLGLIPRLVAYSKMADLYTKLKVATTFTIGAFSLHPRWVPMGPPKKTDLNLVRA